jgi:hypothetical protein
LSPLRGAATLTLSVKAERALASQHVALTASKPAVRRRSSYALPDSSGKWNFANADQARAPAG